MVITDHRIRYALSKRPGVENCSGVTVFEKKLDLILKFLTWGSIGLTVTSMGGSNFFPEIRRICMKVGMLWVLMFTKERWTQRASWQRFICLELEKNRWFLTPYLTWSVYGSSFFRTPEKRFDIEVSI